VSVFNLALRSNRIFQYAKIRGRYGKADILYMVIHFNLSFVLAPLPSN